MPAINFASLPDWVQWVLIVGAIAAALVGIFALIRKAWKSFSTVLRVGEALPALLALPEFMETTKAFQKTASAFQAATTKTLEGQDEKIDLIHHEVNYNNGSSVKDAIHRVETQMGKNTIKLARMSANQSRIEKGVAGLYTRDEIDAKTAAINDEIERTRPPIKRPTCKPTA